jgi:glycosyltransferase involved in cell wall biosynthesis
MRILYLFSGYRSALIEKVQKGEDPGSGTWGLLALRSLGHTADIAELEQWFPSGFAQFLRYKVFGIYGAHLPFLPRFFSYDVIFTAGAFTTQVVFTFLKGIFRFKRPLWVMHDFSIMGLLGKETSMRQRIFAYVVSRSAGIVTLSRREAEMLKGRFPHLTERIAFIPSGIDTEFFAPRGIPTERLIFAIGIDPDRDWKGFFAACAGIDARVVVAGRPTRARWEPTDSQIERRFFTLPEMLDLYAKAAVVVIPLDTASGINDAMGCSTLYESMAAGKAIVASRTHTMESYITDGENGLLVPERDVQAMRAAIMRVLDDEALQARLGSAARTYALQHLKVRDKAAELAAFFERLMRGSDRA